MKGLMLHCGAEQVNREVLGEYLPKEKMGARHNPVPYIEFIEQVTEQLNRVGFKIKTEAFGVTKEGARMFGLMELESKYSDYAPMIGVRGSYDQTLPRAAALGSGVFVCDNLCFSGDVTMKTKQTTFINDRLPQLLTQAFDRLPKMVEHQNARFDAYRNTQLTPRQGDAALIEMVRQEILAPSYLGTAIDEWDNPSHDEHAEQGHSVWRLHNAVTEAVKPANPERAAVMNTMERTTKMSSFLDEVVGL